MGLGVGWVIGLMSVTEVFKVLLVLSSDRVEFDVWY